MAKMNTEIGKWENFDYGAADYGATLAGDTFRGFEPLVRESTQNAIDAHDPEKNDRPVIVEFDLIKFRREDIPGIQEFTSLCEDRIRINTNQSEKNRLTEIREALKKSEFWTLKIGDHNTTGLEFKPNEEDCSWRNLVIATNRSDKSGPQGGSYGLGSGTLLANSACRIVFFSSRDRAKNYHFQGRGFLSSKPQGRNPAGIQTYWGPFVFYGQGTYSSIPLDISPSPIFAERTEEDPGTDIYIANLINISKEGFVSADGKLTADGWNFIWLFVFNFAPAIKNSLVSAVFKQNGKEICQINAKEFSFLDDLQENKFALENATEAKRYCNFLKKYLSNELIEKPILDSDRVIATVSSEPGFKDPITYAARSIGMLVKTPWKRNFRLRNLTGHAKARFILHVTDKESNEILRSIEKPDHLMWDPDILNEKNTIAEKLQKFLREKTREIISEGFSTTTKDQVEIKGLISAYEGGSDKNIADLTIKPTGLNCSIRKNPKPHRDNPGEGGEKKPGGKPKVNPLPKPKPVNKPNPKPLPTIRPGINGDDLAETRLDIQYRILSIDPTDGIYLLKFKAPADKKSIALRTYFIPDEPLKEGERRTSIESVQACSGAKYDLKRNQILLDEFNQDNVKITFKLKEKLMSSIEVSFNG